MTGGVRHKVGGKKKIDPNFTTKWEKKEHNDSGINRGTWGMQDVRSRVWVLQKQRKDHEGNHVRDV